MLTRDLLNYRVRSGTVKFDFIAPDDAAGRGTAEVLIAAWSAALAQGLSRGELEERLEATLKGSRKPLVAQGMHKILCDNSEWSLPQDGVDYPAARARLFIASAQARRDAGGDYAAFRRMLETDPEFALLMQAGIYPDLPENERIVSLAIGDPGELIRRYNLSMVQSLLLHAQQLEVTVGAAEPAELRRLFRAMKFFRLLARVEKREKGTIRLTVDGPLAMFGEIRKYGMQLASFFPAVVRLPAWRIAATVRIRERSLNLVLDQSSGLVSHYRNDGAYIPEEIRLFAEYFKTKAPDWRMVEAAPLIQAPPEVIFPDFCFARTGEKRKICVELFHRWHATALPARLAWLEEHPAVDLALGVDRALLPDGELTALVEKHPALEARLFAFRDFPGVDRVRKVLERF